MLTKDHTASLVAGLLSAVSILALSSALAPTPAAAQFVCGGSATGAESQTGAGANAAGGVFNLACGPLANASGISSSNVAIGRQLFANGDNGANIAIGQFANASGFAAANIAIGESANAAGGNGLAIAIGVLNTARGNSTAIGAFSYATQGGNSAFSNIAIGFSASAGGRSTNALNNFTDTALGAGAEAGASGNGQFNATAVGQGALANVANGTAIGQGAISSAPNSVAVGRGSIADVANTVSVGIPTGERRIVNVAAGTLSATSTDAVNGSQLYTALQSGASGAFQANNAGANSPPQASGADSVAGGFGAVASGNSAIAIGTNATASGTSSIAIGQGSTAGFANSVAVGQGVTTTRAGQVLVGTAANTYTLPGIASAASLAAQAGPINVVTSDANGNLAAAPLSSFASAGSVAALTSSLGGLQAGFNSLSQYASESRREARNGSAMAIAAAQVRYDDRPGKFSVGAGLGTFKGQGGFAGGLGFTSADAAWRANVGAQASFRGDWGVGGGMSFTLN